MMNECVTNFDHVYIDSRAHVRARIHFHAYFMYSATTYQPLYLGIDFGWIGGLGSNQMV